MATTTSAALTVVENVQLDLGHTDLIGDLTFDGEVLALITPSGTSQPLARTHYSTESGAVLDAPRDHILIEEIGLYRSLPAALDKTDHFLETRRYKGISSWGADVVELKIAFPHNATTGVAQLPPGAGLE